MGFKQVRRTHLGEISRYFKNKCTIDYKLILKDWCLIADQNKFLLIVLKLL